MSDPAGGDPSAPDPFARYAGTVLWPGTPHDLTDTTLCPACQTPLVSRGCPSCGLDLRHPVAAELLAVSTDAARLLDRRTALIGRLRFDAAQAAAHQARRAEPEPAAASASGAPPSAPRPQARPTPPTEGPPRGASSTQRVGHPPAPRRPAAVPRDPALPPKRSSVQVLLLVVGVTLVSVAAIFFLTVAWIFTGLLVRSVIIGAFTVAVLLTAAVLKRRGLGVTAEGIGALAVVLVLLDAWSLRQNNLVGLETTDEAGYWGVSLLVCSGLFLGWHAFSGLRVASVAGFAAAAPALGLLLSAAAIGQDAGTRVYLGFLGAAVGALVHRFTWATTGSNPTATGRLRLGTDRAPERAITLVLAVLALLGAFLSGLFVDGNNDLGPLWYLGAVAVVALLHAVTVLTRMPHPAGPGTAPAPQPVRDHPAQYTTAGQPNVGSVVFASFCSAFAVLSASAIPTMIAIRRSSTPLLVTAPLLVALSLALVLELFAHRLAGPRQTAARWAARTAFTAAGFFALGAVTPAASPLSSALLRGLAVFGGWNGTRVERALDRQLGIPGIGADNLWALGALLVAGLLATLAWHWGGLLRRRVRAIAALFAVITVLAVAFTGPTWLITLLYGLLGGGALLVLFAHTRRLLRPGGSGPESSGPESSGPGSGVLDSLRPIVVALLAVSISTGFLVGWAHSDTWWIGTTIGILSLVSARGLLPRGTRDARDLRAHGRGALLAGALLLTLLAAAVAPWALTLGARPTAAVLLVNQLRGLTLATALLQLLVALPLPRLIDRVERRWAFQALLVPTTLAFAAPVVALAAVLDPAGRAALLQPEPAAGLIHTGVLLAAAALWLGLRGNRAAGSTKRLTAIFALAPVLYLLFGAVLAAMDSPAAVTDSAAPAAAIVCSALGLTLASLASGTQRTHQPQGTPGTRAPGTPGAPDVRAPAGTSGGLSRLDRLALDAGAAFVLLPATVLSLVAYRPLGWLALLLAGVAVLLAAIAPDGLFGSRSPRRDLGWVALCLGIAALWLGLYRSGETALEPYVLPVAGVLLGLAWLIHRFGRADDSGPVAGWLTLAGLVIALVPLALVSGTGTLIRPLAISIVSAVLLLGAAILRRTPSRSPYLAAAVASGALGLVLTSGARITALLAPDEAAGIRVEAWLLPALLVLVIAGVLVIRAAIPAGDLSSDTLGADAPAGIRDLGHTQPAWVPHGEADAAGLLVGYGLVAVAIVGLLVAEVAVLGYPPLAMVRVVLLAWTFSAAHLVLFRLDPRRTGRWIAWLSIAAGGGAVLAGYVHGVPDPIEVVTVPLAVALITSGGLHLDATPSARSWPWLAPGLLVLLVPSLLFDVTESPLWRVVGLGLLALAVIVAGLRLRLQAPFVLGAGVLLVHGVAQLWPWISLAYAAVEWWLWLGIGGTLLIVLAARYEQRIRNLKQIALGISSLR
jgi:hypothetical protein